MLLQGEHVLVDGVTDGHVSAGNNSQRVYRCVEVKGYRKGQQRPPVAVDNNNRGMNTNSLFKLLLLLIDDGTISQRQLVCWAAGCLHHLSAHKGHA